MSSGLNSWTREVVCYTIVPIKIDPKASAEEAEEQVRQLFEDCTETDDGHRGAISIEVDKFFFSALPLTEES